MKIINLSSDYDVEDSEYDFSDRGKKRGYDSGGAEYDSSIKKITDIRAAARDENRVNVFVDGKYEFSLDIAQLVDLKIKIGLVISEEELERFKQASEFGKLYQRALEWVLIRPRSLKETQDYLKERVQKRRLENLKRERNRERMAELKKAGDVEGIQRMREYKTPLKELPEISSELSGLVFERLLERGYLDDLKFAEYYVENRFVKKGVSMRRLEMELLKKGISKEIVAEVFTNSGRDERGEILKMVAKKRAKYDDPQKLLAYLVRQGFSYELAKEYIIEGEENN
ncbi:MAG: RecX family transcriptional regulator [Candidatus Saccharibacteria bacterium]|nr:RecX family transcriptional regulator [Candidatus Saccharibacteria bacterium]